MLGVYPNNRLIVARRFAAPVGDDLTSISLNDNVAPLATLISWVPDGDDFIDINFGEKWEDVKDGNFTNVLNDIGRIDNTKDWWITQKRAFSNSHYQVLWKVFNIKLWRRWEYLLDKYQWVILTLYVMQNAKSYQKESGSGLTGKFKVKMAIEYEQKYIEGIDPTLVYYDIIANALAFGTSDAYFQFNGKFHSGVNNFIKDLQSGNVRIIEA